MGALTIFNIFEGFILDLVLSGEEEISEQKKILVDRLRRSVLSGKDRKAEEKGGTYEML
jgi:hypothetical protein